MRAILSTAGIARFRLPFMALYALYDLLTTVAAPIGATALLANPKHRALLGRFAPVLPELTARPIWIQACSVGEVNAAKPIVRAMRERWPAIPILLTTSTVSGHALACSTMTDCGVAWFPFDHRLAVASFLKRANPRALVLLETEIWPNVIRMTRRGGIPAIVMNCRISDKHYPRYKRYRLALRHVFGQLTAIGAQNEEYAERLRELGASSGAVRVTGATKFDGVRMSVPKDTVDAIRGEMGISSGEPVIVFGSTRPGDEALAASCWQALREEFPGMRLVVVPRHLDRLADALAPFDEPVLTRSEVRQGRRSQGERVLFVDTTGELVSFYAIATLAVIGGSFYPGVNGHNPLESAALGVPTIFGPHMRNFIDPAKALVDGHGAVQVEAEGLLDTLRGLLADEPARNALAENGRDAVRANQGAIQRNLDLLAEVML